MSRLQVSRLQVSQHDWTLSFRTLAPTGGELQMLLLKRQFNEWTNLNNRGLDDMLHAVSFHLVWWIDCYFISTKISLLLGKVTFCVVLTVNIHIWKVKWKKKTRNLRNKTNPQRVCFLTLNLSGVLCVWCSIAVGWKNWDKD